MMLLLRPFFIGILFFFPPPILKAQNSLSTELEDYIEGINELYFNLEFKDSTKIAYKSFECLNNYRDHEKGNITSFTAPDGSYIFRKVLEDIGDHCDVVESYFFRNDSLLLSHFKNSSWFFNKNINSDSDSSDFTETTSDYFIEIINYYSNNVCIRSLERKSNNLEDFNDLEYQIQEILESFPESVDILRNWYQFSFSKKNCSEYFR